MKRVPFCCGFALVVVLLLMALLVALVVGLSSVVSLDIQGASTMLKDDQARKNAFTGLYIALGELQRTLGPDQRVTAPSDLASAPGGSTQVSHWTGVWRDPSPTDLNRDPELLSWLVSGNTPDSPRVITPQSAESWPAPDATNGIVWLVNTGSTSQNDPLPTGASDKRIKLPVQSLFMQNPNPGGPKQTSGHYAYWVGDENVKARVNLPDPWRADLTVVKRVYSFINAQRSGIELLARNDAAAPALLAILSDSGLYDPAKSDLLSKVSTRGDMASWQDNAVGSGASDLREILKWRYHDTTVASESLLTDALRGGIRKDLTRQLGSTAPPPGAPLDVDPIFNPAEVGGAASSLGVPKWGLLRSYVHTVTSGAALTPRPQTELEVGIYPVIAYAGLGLDLAGGTGVSPAPGNSVNLHLFPAAVLWNPYNVPLAASSYELSLWLTSPASGSPTGAVPLLVRTGFTTKITLDLNKAGSSTSGTPFLFRIQSPQIGPGEALIFTLDSSSQGASYSPGLTLVNARLHRYCILPTGTTFAGEPSWSLSSSLPSGVELWASIAQPGGAAYQTVQRVGYLSASNTLIAAGPLQGGAVVTNPRVIGRLQLAQRFGDFRWLRNCNPRAPLSTRTKMDSWGSAANAGRNALYNATFSAGTSMPDFTGTQNKIGLGVEFRDVAYNSSINLDQHGGEPTLYDFPFPSSEADTLTSIGRLQNANVSLVDIYPNYPIGGSLADPRIARTSLIQTGGTGSTVPGLENIFDLSYLLNRELWDQYFFSTVPDGLTGSELADPNYHLPNGRLRFALQPGTAASDFTSSSGYMTNGANLRLTGGFNINSTSEEAWAAFLGSAFNMDYFAATKSSYPAKPLTMAAFSRHAKPIARPNYYRESTSSMGVKDRWGSYYDITPANLRRLAHKIVQEVKARGPFLSLSDFVNRRLANNATGLNGALDAAIDATIYDEAGGAVQGINHVYPWVSFNTIVTSGNVSGSSYYPEHISGSAGSPVQPVSSKAAGSPLYLTQNDLLSFVGSSITPRSDTFLIRGYGDSVNPRNPNRIEARAWYEAVVQRTPNYVDPSQSPETPPAELNALNQQFGRKFQLVSFRWLLPEEI